MKLNLKKTALVTGLISSVAVVGLANAGNYAQYKTQNRIDYARVIHVKPITKRVETSTPVQQCWDEKVAYRKPHHNRYNNGYVHKNEALGALIGAVVGNQVAKKSSNRRGATAAGAVIGTLIGNDMKKKNHHRYEGQHTSYRTEKRCHTEHQVSYSEEVVAYKVRYKYRGKEYSTRMNNHPGDRIKVSVSVTPVEY